MDSPYTEILGGRVVTFLSWMVRQHLQDSDEDRSLEAPTTGILRSYPTLFYGCDH